MHKVLIANRGEIALRIIRTLRDMGKFSIAVYSDADHSSRHRLEADAAIRLQSTSSQDPYLNQEALLKAAKLTQADAIHPGYGFLSENPDFAQAVNDAGLTFIGPSAHAMRLLGDKLQAKAHMRKAGLPVAPGSEEGLTHISKLRDLIPSIGLPLILKAAAGGGGRGMRVVRKMSELEEAFEGCVREAWTYFNSETIFAERYLEAPRHIEFQILCDQFGHGVHLGERDCTVQRRHQKLLEEAPSQFLTPELRAHLGAMAVKAATHAGFSGAGTVEFICGSKDEIYFMEMNPRIQVEHPVTEEITRLDLIREQILISEGHPLPYQQEDITFRGWSIECRLNAENPLLGFLPSPGQIKKIKWPQGPHCRIDSHAYSGYEIPSNYDSLIAKLIVWAPDRHQAIQRMLRCLRELAIEGVPTTTKLHEAILQHPDFVAGQHSTGFLEEAWPDLEAAMSQAEQAKGLALLSAILTQEDSYQLPEVLLHRDSRTAWTHWSRNEAIL